jgi:hypothetical protein
VPGLTVRVLGPPTVEQYAKVGKQASRDPEFWMLRLRAATSGLRRAAAAASTASTSNAAAPTPADSTTDGHVEHPDEDGTGEVGTDTGYPRTTRSRTRAKPVWHPTDKLHAIPPGPVRWLVDTVSKHQVFSATRLVRALDNALNNTSLILLLEVGNLRLLFPGDAQIENWRYTLDQLDTDPDLLDALTNVDLYKVGHHGSRNATPRTLVSLWANRSSSRGPMTMLMSTRPGVHGDTVATAVPRATLVRALKKLGSLYSTDALGRTRAFVEVVADATGGPFQRVP